MRRRWTKKYALRLLIAALLILTISSCSGYEDTSKKPWVGFAMNKEGKVNWWLNSHESYDACIESMHWDVINSEHKAWYTEPVGCGYSSNNKIKSLFMNIIVADINHFKCIVESKNPEARKMKIKYSPILKGYKDDCIDNFKYTIIYK